LALLLLRVLSGSFGGQKEEEEEEEECRTQHAGRAWEFVALSGASTSAGVAAAAAEGVDALALDGWVAHRFEVAEAQHRACRENGGRYWETEMNTMQYLRALQFEGEFSGMHYDGCGAHDGSCPSNIVDDLKARLELLPELIRCGLCAPQSCEVDDVRNVVFRRYLAMMLHLDFDLPPPSADEFQAKELLPWADLQVDFVIAGCGNCGTTSLRKNLLRHRDVAFTSTVEDQWFWRHDRGLPYRSEVDSFNTAWVEKAQRLVGPQPTIRGLADPGLFGDARIRQVLARIPSLKVVVVVCDPVSRFEKFYWRHHLCRSGRPESAAERPCWPTLAGGLQAEPEMVARDASGQHLRSLLALLGPRLWLMHQDSLRFSAKRTYNGLAAFLGVQPFPTNTEFRRHNSQRGHRTELCRNASVHAVLQQSFAEEYRDLEAVLHAAAVDVPVALRLRRTRCDRAEELGGGAG